MIVAEPSRGRVVHAADPHPRQRRSLPVTGHYQPTAGPRCECARADDCIDAHLAAHRHGDTPARCPGEREESGAWVVTCKFYLPPMVARATEYASTGRGAGGE